MRKINVLLIAIAFIAIGCSGDNPTGPSVGKNGIYTVKVFTVPYDEQTESWDEAKKEYEGTVKMNGNVSIRRANYAECYGKNWRKGSYNDNMGAVLESYRENGDSAIYRYDSDNFIIEEIYYSGGVVENRVAYTNENGKVKSRTSSGDHYDPVSNYEYGENGYIKNEFKGDPVDTISRYEYHHDDNGYLIEKWYYSSQSDPEPSILKYINNNQGLLIRVEDVEGEVFVEYKYNDLGMMVIIEITGEIMNEIKYNSSGLPIEIIVYEYGNPKEKKYLEYD